MLEQAQGLPEVTKYDSVVVPNTGLTDHMTGLSGIDPSHYHQE
jgi:hypothetical protein